MEALHAAYRLGESLFSLVDSSLDNENLTKFLRGLKEQERTPDEESKGPVESAATTAAAQQTSS